MHRFIASQVIEDTLHADNVNAANLYAEVHFEKFLFK